MNFLRKSLVMLVWVLVPVSVMGSELTAVESAERSVNELLARVSEVREFYESDRDRYFAAIADEVSKFVDFREVAIGVMARHSREATDEQIAAFAEKLKVTLTRFYGSTLVEYGGQELNYMPPDEPPADPERATNVRMQIINDGSRVDLQYTMFLNDEGEWKLRNLFVAGINLRRQYNTQFNALMGRHDNDIDAVINAWQ